MWEASTFWLTVGTFWISYGRFCLPEEFIDIYRQNYFHYFKWIKDPLTNNPRMINGLEPVQDYSYKPVQQQEMWKTRKNRVKYLGYIKHYNCRKPFKIHPVLRKILKSHYFTTMGNLLSRSHGISIIMT